MKPLAYLYALLFGCRHKRLTFPITPKPQDRRTFASAVTGTYIVCLDCGSEFPYDWRSMQIVKDARAYWLQQAAEELLEQ